MPSAAVSYERKKTGLPALNVRARRQRARRSFVAVVVGLGIFVTFQLGLAVAIEFGPPELRDPRYGSRLHLVQKSLHTEPTKPWTILMLGSSRVQWAFQVEKGEEKSWAETVHHPVASFNFGIPGAAPLTELLTWSRLRRDGVRPSLLLVEVLPALLAAPAYDYDKAFLPSDRLAWSDLPLIERYAGSFRKDTRRDWQESWPTACYTHRASLLGLVAPDLLPTEYRSPDEQTRGDSGLNTLYDPKFTSEQRLRAIKHAWGEYHARLAEFQLGGPQCQALRELLVSCHEEGIAVALVVMPEGPTFRSWYPPGRWETIKEWLTKLSREYDAPLVNAHEWINDENDFMDSHHLLRSGRTKFKERLARECIFPLLSGSLDKNSYAGRLP